MCLCTCRTTHIENTKQIPLLLLFKYITIKCSTLTPNCISLRNYCSELAGRTNFNEGVMHWVKHCTKSHFEYNMSSMTCMVNKHVRLTLTMFTAYDSAAPQIINTPNLKSQNQNTHHWRTFSMLNHKSKSGKTCWTCVKLNSNLND